MTDATTAIDLLTAVEGYLVRVTADSVYDMVAVYESVRARSTTVVVPPARTANVSGQGPRSPARDRTITLVKQFGRRRRKQASGSHRQAGCRTRASDTRPSSETIFGPGTQPACQH